jgi:hypothetical protein
MTGFRWLDPIDEERGAVLLEQHLGRNTCGQEQ